MMTTLSLDLPISTRGPWLERETQKSVLAPSNQTILLLRGLLGVPSTPSAWPFGPLTLVVTTRIFENPNSAECLNYVKSMTEEFWQIYTADEPIHSDVHLLPYPLYCVRDRGPLYPRKLHGIASQTQ
eukprot:TRINITY_DN34252_c0_g1_i1.p1 TRINITY_DN34252_c0_g1~~TRINITY_DN34252_c0_g1_i1.p1  ORF type:complete len:127 (+),score=10.46 TRINITY_DN34252_c0_g1_i1:96-476(+)